MARHRDLPVWLSAVHRRHRVPHHADAVLAVLVSALVTTVDVREVIGFSSFGVLVYYAIANVAALTQPANQRHWPRSLNLLGLTGCTTLVATLPWESVATGAAALSLGLGVRGLVQTRRLRLSPSG